MNRLLSFPDKLMAAAKPKNLPMIKRLKAQMLKCNINARELAERANVGPSFVYDILSGKSTNPTTRKLSLVAEVLGTTVPYLLHGVQEEPLENEIYAHRGLPDAACVHGLKIKVDKHDTPIIKDDANEGSLYFRQSWIKERLGAIPAELRVIKVKGDAMQPTLQENDILLINLNHKIPTPPGIFVLFDGIGLVTKRLEYISDSRLVRVISDNPKYISYEKDIGEINIIGRVVWFGREM